MERMCSSRLNMQLHVSQTKANVAEVEEMEGSIGCCQRPF